MRYTRPAKPFYPRVSARKGASGAVIITSEGHTPSAAEARAAVSGAVTPAVQVDAERVTRNYHQVSHFVRFLNRLVTDPEGYRGKWALSVIGSDSIGKADGPAEYAYVLGDTIFYTSVKQAAQVFDSELEAIDYAIEHNLSNVEAVRL